MKIVSVGFDNAVLVSRIVCVANATAAPMKRLREQARKNHKLVDVTNGRRSRAIVITDSDHIILSSIQPQTLTQRIEEIK